MKTFNDLREELKQEDPMDYIIMEIVGKLMAARDRQKLSQRALSKKSGIPQKTISRIETGKDIPQLKTLLKLASALGLELTMIDSNVKKEHSATLI
ncbi:helix-turn-helix domain-containing protein [Aureibacillus halotolerans]|uniref:Transcriptional regulator n=1 Tax=Aureibacillus halotolerans TaxID=1508390 RepID=A0A4R6U638_9BACI|nr:helix-turn-helix transcriptional regulator [Aureibacillus halotolerans]TDQ41042.1 transcriptional regulator [Aureibacillus halotolerans]